MDAPSGAATAAKIGRGNRAFGNGNEDYQVTLPTLPTGQSVVNTLFLHGDLRARPYRVEDFRDALARLSLLPEVIALGAYQMSHVWAVTFSSAEAAKKLVAETQLKVKDRRCLVIDPTNQDVRIKVHWLLHNVPDEDVRQAFAPYGKVTEITKQRWRVQGVTDKGSTTRTVSLKLKAGVKIEDIPHQIRVGGDNALVVVAGRAPLCLRCHSMGHVRRECRVPKCTVCHRFGHTEATCVRTYAKVVGPTRNDEASEFLMDEDEAEESAMGTTETTTKQETPTPTRVQETPPNDTQATVQHQGELLPSPAHEVEDATVAAGTSGVLKGTPGQTGENMETTGPTTANVVAKRPHGDVSNGARCSRERNTDEPPSKATPLRPPTLRHPSINVPPSSPPDKRPGGAQPP